MGYSSLGAAGAMPMTESGADRLAGDLRDVLRARGMLCYDALRARGWSDADLRALLAPAIEILRGRLRSNWRACPSAIVADARISLIAAGAAGGAT